MMAATLRRDSDVHFARRWHAWLRVLSGAAVALVLLVMSAPVSALEVPPLRGRVNDLAGVLSAQERAALEQRLAAFEQQTRHQFALLTLPSLEGDAIEDFSIRTAEAWQLGDSKQDDGLILLVVVKDRKVRIEVGYGLEGDITDALSGRVIREVLAPSFRQGEHARGIADAFSVLMKAAGGEGVALPPPASGSKQKKQPSIPGILAGVVVLLLLLFGRGRGGGSMLAGALLGSALGGGGRGGGGGGGGYRGRGGGFGGGGASGGW